MHCTLIRFGSLMVLALVINCNDKKEPPGIIGTWVLRELEQTSCSDPLFNKMEQCKQTCRTYSFKILQVYDVSDSNSPTTGSGFYRIENNVLFLSGIEYEFTLTDSELTLIHHHWTVDNPTVTPVYCDTYERYSRL
jgi:hypothetical protein